MTCMNQLRDMVGQKYGRLTVVKLSGRKAHTILWFCRCDCGNEKVVAGGSLRKGFTKSCGCLNSEIVKARNIKRATHRRTGTSEYATWRDMRSRCSNPNHHAWKDYGRRGITVCDRWSRFENFLADMGVRPSPEHSLDRIDNDKGYSPENCRWELRQGQCNNRRSTKKLEFNGQIKSISEWGRELGFSRPLLFRRLRQGWSVEKALTTPQKIKLLHKISQFPTASC